MQAVQNFAFESNLVRAVDVDGEPWFVGRDVCHVLGLKNVSDALERLDDDERGRYTVPTPSAKGVANNDPLEVSGNLQEVVIVSEPGVFRLIFTSRKPEAERFKRWLAHEVLPAIRRTGRFAVDGDDGSMETMPRVVRCATLGEMLRLIDTARLLGGIPAGRDLWKTLGLPELTVPQTERRDAEAFDCLWHLLRFRPDGGRENLAEWISAAMEGNETYRMNLTPYGIRASADIAGGFYVANRNHGLFEIYQETIWKNGRHRFVLRRLPGAHVPGRAANFRFDGQTSRALFVPEHLLDAREIPST